MTTIGKGGHPTAERAAAIDTAIVVATLTLFARSGTEFSMDQVAVEAGVSKQAIYRRFDSKQALIMHAIEGGTAMLVDDVTDDLSGDQLVDPVAALKDACFKLFERGGPGAIGATVHMEAEAIRSEAFRASLLKSRQALDMAMQGRLARIDAAGRLAEGSIKVQTQVLLDLLLGANIRLNTAQMFSDAERAAMFAERWAVFCTVSILDPAQNTTAPEP